MPDIHGNIEGVRKSTLAELQTLYDFPIERDEYLPIELARLMGRYSCALNREISLYITRDGEIIDITVGDTASVPLCDIRLRRSARRLSCVRCVHTHPRGSAELSDVDITALKSLLLDSMCALGVSAESEVTGVQAAFLHERVNGEPQPVCTPILSLRRLPQSAWMDEIVLSDQRVMQGEDKAADDAPERALLVGIESDESLDELADLAESAGAVVVGRSFQRKTRPDTATYIGSGKANELALDAQALEADIIIVDDELTGAQLHNLEDIVGVKVVDRTTLILDIFAQRAKTAEGRLQVSLAQLKYQSGRLIGQGLVLSRLAGGIGTRGPGESKLEIDRRRIRERITALKRELSELEGQRALRRRARERNAIPVVALVGYTNTGKSSLLNKITGSDVYIKDRLFATLDGEVTDDQGRRGVLEIKTSTPNGKLGWAKWDGRVPLHYWCQIQHQMLATGWDFVDLLASLENMDGDLSIRTYRFERTELTDDLAWLLEREEDFYKNHVLTGTPPAAILRM